MDSSVWIVIGLVILLLLILLWRIFRGPPPKEAIEQMLSRREKQLRQEHFERASQSGKPRGLRWIEIEWGEETTLAWDRPNQLWVALTETTIRFEAVEGSDMEGLPAVSNLRTSTALFFFDKGDWRASGKTIFNLTPGEVLERFASQYERQDPNNPLAS